MATAKKLPSGSWRCQVYSHTEQILQSDGTIKNKRVYESFTCDDPSSRGKRKAEAMAAEFAAEKEDRRKPCNLTLGDAIDKYIKSRESVLSPCTIRDYRRIRRQEFQNIMNVKVSRVTQDDIQQAVNLDAQKHSPKTVRNNHGLISAVLKQYRPDFALNTALPQKIRPDIYVPTDDEVKMLMTQVQGTEMELPVLLAAFGPMRRGEICALSTDDISGNVVHVCRNMVRTPDNTWIIKQPKSYAGNRYIDYPDFVADKWKGREGLVTDLNPGNITDKFRIVVKRAGLPHFRFHDLRHYSASIQHALGIPDSYIMARGGWGNDGVLKAVYRHTLEDRVEQMNTIANDHFSKLCNTKCNTTKKQP